MIKRLRAKYCINLLVQVSFRVVGGRAKEMVKELKKEEILLSKPTSYSEQF